MKKTILLITIFTLLASCSPSQAAVQTAIANTQTAQNVANLQTQTVQTVVAGTNMTATANAVPTIPSNKDLDLSMYLAISTDLPSGYTGGQISYEPFKMFKDIPTPEYVIAQDLLFKGETSGGINVMVFSSNEDREKAFQLIQSNLGDDAKLEISNDGQYKIGYTTINLGIQAVDMQAAYCNTIYFVRLTNTLNVEDVANYLSYVVARTKDSIACPQNITFPTPEATPTSAQQNPVSLSGVGDSIVDIDWPAIPAIVHVEGNASSSYFGIVPYDQDGKRATSLVNTTEPYDGINIFNSDGQHLTRLEIKAAGEWKITIMDISQAKTLTVPGTLEGTGDDVIAINGAIPDLITIDGNSSGQYFGIVPYDKNVKRMFSLVNTTDVYQGTNIIQSGTTYLVITAIGPWKITISDKK